MNDDHTKTVQLRGESVRPSIEALFVAEVFEHLPPNSQDQVLKLIKDLLSNE